MESISISSKHFRDSQLSPPGGIHKAQGSRNPNIQDMPGGLECYSGITEWHGIFLRRSTWCFHRLSPFHRKLRSAASAIVTITVVGVVCCFAIEASKEWCSAPVVKWHQDGKILKNKYIPFCFCQTVLNYFKLIFLCFHQSLRVMFLSLLKIFCHLINKLTLL